MPPLNDDIGRSRVSFRRASILNFLNTHKNSKTDSENQEDGNGHDQPESGHQSKSQAAQGWHHHPHHLRHHSAAPPLSSNPVHSGPPQLQLPSWSSNNLQEDRIPTDATSNPAESRSSARDVKLDEPIWRKLFDNDENRRAAARRKKEEEENHVRESRANEAARIIYASCMAGHRVQRRRARARRLMDLAGTVRDGTAVQGERSDAVRRLGRSAEKADPFPDLYWRTWGRAIPPGLEMDPFGEMWEDGVEEKGEQAGRGNFDGTSPPHGGRKRDSVVDGATVDVHAVGIAEQEVLPNWKAPRATTRSTTDRGVSGGDDQGQGNEQSADSCALPTDKAQGVERKRGEVPREHKQAQEPEESEAETAISITEPKQSELPESSTSGQQDPNDEVDAPTRHKAKGKLIDPSFVASNRSEATCHGVQSTRTGSNGEPDGEEPRQSDSLKMRRGDNRRRTLTFGAAGTSGAENSSGIEPASATEPTLGTMPSSVPGLTSTRPTTSNTVSSDASFDISVAAPTARAAGLPPRPPNNSRDSEIPKSDMSTSSSEIYLSGNEGSQMWRRLQSQQAKGSSASASIGNESRFSSRLKPGQSGSKETLPLVRPEPQRPMGVASAGRESEDTADGGRTERGSRRATLRATIRRLFRPSRVDKQRPI
ncbi:uncharacterized protein P884DRAFT_271676 [Thermothelomyces heterothallicus CBS 202.75]|uniref:uncharacterized protein n=1 Tax=Thermothelomyces heterothallicus CBS 202.75 TaxID=1149848 RepID=UPI003743CB49